MAKSKKTKKVVKKVQKKAPAKTVVKKNALGTPYGDRVLIKPQAAEEKTSFGIIIPDQAKEKPEQGVVVAVGEGKKGPDGKIIPVGVKVGDTVLLKKYTYEEVKINGTEYYLASEDNILFIF